MSDFNKIWNLNFMLFGSLIYHFFTNYSKKAVITFFQIIEKCNLIFGAIKLE